MAKVALLIGTGYSGEDVLHKVPWVRYFAEKHNIYVASRIKPEIHLTEPLKQLIGDVAFNDIKNAVDELIEIASGFYVVYDSPCLKKQHTATDVDKLQSWLGVSFKYISSFDRRFFNRWTMVDSRSQHELNNYLAGLVEFFKDFFTENQIRIFINTIEDDVFSVTAYYVARKLGVQILGFVTGRFPRRGLMFCKDFSDVCVWNEKDVNWSEIISLYTESTIAGKEILTRNFNYWRLISLPRRLKNVESVINYGRFVEHVIRNYDYERFIYENINVWVESRKYLIKLARRFLIKTILNRPYYNDKYFLFPLHYMDDAQITFREPLLDQFKLISIISRALPVGYYLYVKPHPHYFGTDVSFKELIKVARLKNVKVIDPSTPPVNLIRNSVGVITVNSTTGFEALVMGVPVLTFGHDFYCKGHLCYVVQDINKLSETLIAMINRCNQPDRVTVMDFVKTVYANTIWIDGINYDYGFYGLTDIDGRNISLALNRIVEALGSEAKC